ADVKFEGVAAETPLQVYLPLPQESVRSMAIVIRAAAAPGPLQVAVEDAVHGLNKDLPVFQPRTMDQILDQSMARERMSMLVLMVFAVVALTLASVGLYGVVSHGVAERTHEIGVRMALGAEARHVVALVVRQGLTAAVAGTILGVASALVLSRAIRDLLFGIAPTDPATFLTVVVLLLVVALVAC